MADETAVAAQVTNATAIEPELSKRFQVTAKGTNTNTSVIGTTQDYPTVRNESIDTGTWFTAAEVTDSAKVAVLGPSVMAALFPRWHGYEHGHWSNYKGEQHRVHPSA